MIVGKDFFITFRGNTFQDGLRQLFHTTQLKHLHYMCTSFALWASHAAGYCEDHKERVSSLSNLMFHNRIAFQRFETWAAMSHYYLRARDSWMAASMHEASQMYQRAARAFLRAEWHASHCRI